MNSMLREQLDAAKFRTLCDNLFREIPAGALSSLSPDTYETWVKLIAHTYRFGKAGTDGAIQLLQAHERRAEIGKKS
jgi:hypothetical protein